MGETERPGDEVKPGVWSAIDRVAERIVVGLIVVSSVVVGMGYLLVWTTDIEEPDGGSDADLAAADGARSDVGPALAGLEGVRLPGSLELVGAPAPTVRFAFPEASEGWLAVFEVTDNPLRAWQDLGQSIAGHFDLPAPHVACDWVVDGGPSVALSGNGAPKDTTALHCRATAVDARSAESAPAPPRELKVAMWSARDDAYLGLRFDEVATVADGTEVAVGPAATPADLADVPYPREPAERPAQFAGPGDRFPAPLRCLDRARLPEGSQLVALVAAPVLPVSSAAITEPGEIPVTGPVTAIGVLETAVGDTALEDLAGQVDGASVVTRLSESGRTLRATVGTDTAGGYCEVRETNDPSLLLVLYRAG